MQHYIKNLKSLHIKLKLLRSWLSQIERPSLCETIVTSVSSRLTLTYVHETLINTSLNSGYQLMQKIVLVGPSREDSEATPVSKLVEEGEE